MEYFLGFDQFLKEQLNNSTVNTTLGQSLDEVATIEKQIAAIKANIGSIPNKETINGAGVVSNIMKNQLAPAYQKLAAALIKKADASFNKAKSDEAAPKPTTPPTA